MGWLKDEGFGGVMIWSVDMDDFRGVCGTGKYPLINAMKQELAGYTVKLEYDGPYEATGRNAVYTTKDRKCDFRRCSVAFRIRIVVGADYPYGCNSKVQVVSMFS